MRFSSNLICQTSERIKQKFRVFLVIFQFSKGKSTIGKRKIPYLSSSNFNEASTFMKLS